ncbi:aryl-sulfate sulfotransferase [Myxococcota bacterium]|nr:aryl-sulfate sulfotransferase [Myxococcota bacterium]
MPRRAEPGLLPLTFALALAACGHDKDPGDDTGRTGDAPEVLDVQVELAPLMPTVARVSWRTDQPTTGAVEFWYGDDAPRWVRGADGPATEHEAWLVGVPELTDTSFRVYAYQDDTPGTSETATYTTGSLPASVPRPVVERDSDPAHFGGLTLVPVASGPERWTTLLDRAGRLVWAWGGSTLDTQRAHPTLDGRGIIMMDRWPGVTGTDLVRVDYDGVEQWRLSVPYGHHDFALVDDDTFLVLRNSYRIVQFGDEERNLAGDEIVEIRRTGEERVVWNVWDHYEASISDPMHLMSDEYAWDWSHANFLRYSAETDEIHLTLRNINVATGIQRTSGEVLWALQSPVGVGDVLDFPHSVWPTDQGLMVFNQRDYNMGQCAQVLELAGAPADTSPDISWSYDGSACNGVYYVGNAQPLPDDHVLVSWGSSSVIEEVDRSGAAAPWRLAYPPQTWVLYVERLAGAGRLAD